MCGVKCFQYGGIDGMKYEYGTAKIDDVTQVTEYRASAFQVVCLIPEICYTRTVS